MSGFRPIDSKREEFRKYLERAGVMDALTKVLVMLYEEPDKPEDALEYVRSNLGDRRPTVAEVENLRTTLESAQARIEALEKENQELRQQARSEEAPVPLADQLPVSDSDSPSKTPSESPDQPRSD